MRDSDGFNPDNKTELWLKNNHDTRYTLPEVCPLCGKEGLVSGLKASKVYMGIFPYIHVDFTLTCWTEPSHRFNFCFPYNRAMTSGYTVFDSKETGKPDINRLCPWHNVKLEPIRLYGDLVFKDKSRKIQLRCPVCYYSERYTL
jgi:hypothetical protein